MKQVHLTYLCRIIHLYLTAAILALLCTDNIAMPLHDLLAEESRRLAFPEADDGVVDVSTLNLGVLLYKLAEVATTALDTLSGPCAHIL